ncbi:MAG: F0F1 ATP synthase subunit delta [Puniceicoccaceae bacterium]
MAENRYIEELSHRLLELSLTDGLVDEERVQKLLESLSQKPPRYHRQVLRAYRKLISNHLDKHTLKIVSAVDFSPEQAEQLRQEFAAQYQRPLTVEVTVDPGLIAGLKVRIGDDIHDLTICRSLEKLRSR